MSGNTEQKLEESNSTTPAVSKEDKSKDATDVAGRENKGLAGAGVLGKVSEMTDKLPGSKDKTPNATGEGWMQN